MMMSPTRANVTAYAPPVPRQPLNQTRSVYADSQQSRRQWSGQTTSWAHSVAPANIVQAFTGLLCLIWLSLTPVAALAQSVTATITSGTSPSAVAVNPVTNKIYVANNGSNNVTVIDGATNTTTTVAVGTTPWAVAVNPVTNKIYVANYDSANVTVIDGATNTTATVAAGTFPRVVTVNPVTNQIYVANSAS
ncbi:MAG: YncE family protein, partial [Burkholderiales bacterium]